MLVKGYCGCLMYKVGDNGVYICLNQYTNEVYCIGSYEKCNRYLTEYMERISERG
jgi:hypothetical protein